jgi:hypothetical protein
MEQNFSHYEGKEYEVGTRFRTDKGLYIVTARTLDKDNNVEEYEFVEIKETKLVKRTKFDGWIKSKDIKL